MSLRVLYFFAILSLCSQIACKSKEEWKSRTIYQLLTDRFSKTDGSTQSCQDFSNYCGGTFQGIINHLDYIQGMGFDAIWISPVVKNAPGRYHGYHAVDFYAINPEFGTEDDLKNLTQELHKRGMWLMVDIVANHVANDYPQQDIKPFNQDSNYHSPCDVVQSDYNPKNWDHLFNCRLAGLPDLNSEDQSTRQQLMDWIKWLVQTFDVDGLRIDTVQFMPEDFWRSFAQSAGVFQIGEVDDGNVETLAKFQGSLDSVLNYPMFYTLRDVFQSSQSLHKLSDRVNEEKNWHMSRLLSQSN